MLTRSSAVFELRIRSAERRGFLLNEAAANARSDMQAVLASWSAMVAEERGLAKLIRRDIPDLTGFLAAHIDWLFAHDAGPDFADEISATAATARRVCRHDEDEGRALGSCVESDCTGIIVATASAGVSRSSLEIRCDAGHAWQPDEWLLLARRLGRG